MRGSSATVFQQLLQVQSIPSSSAVGAALSASIDLRLDVFSGSEQPQLNYNMGRPRPTIFGSGPQLGGIPKIEDESDRSRDLIGRGLKTFIGIGVKHGEDVFEYVYDLLKRLQPDIITVEQSVNEFSDYHKLGERFRAGDLPSEDKLPRDRRGAMIAGAYYALNNSVPLYFVDGSSEVGRFYADIDLATTLDMTKLEAMFEESTCTIVYNNELRTWDSSYDYDGESGYWMRAYVPNKYFENTLSERNLFAARAINLIAARTAAKSIAHIGGSYHFDIEKFKRDVDPPNEVLLGTISILDLVIANAWEYYEVVT